MKENKDTKYLALVDGSTYAESVCDHVAWIAKRTGGSVELINILGRRGNSDTQVNLSGSIGLGARSALLDELAEHDRQRAQLEQKRGRAILEDAKKRVEAAGVTEVVTRLRHGGLLEAVEEYEQDARIVFIGKRGEAWEIDKDHLGSNLARVVRSSNKPIFVAAHTFKPLERFMIAFDGGRSSSDAVKHVSRSRSLKGLSCCLLSVVTEDKRLKRESQLERAALRLRAAGHEVDIDIRTGDADDVIREKAADDDMDLLVMGAYGHSRIRNFIIGSTTTEMIRSCKIPVLLFR